MQPMIRNREEAERLCVYDSLKFGKISPTDVDCFIEFGNKLFVLIECKNEGAPIMFGQGLALYRLHKAIYESGGKDSLLIICDNRFTEDGDVDVGMSMVRELFFNGSKQLVEIEVTVRQVIEYFLENK